MGQACYAGTTGQFTVQADSGCYAHDIVAVGRKMFIHFSVTIRQHARLRKTSSRTGLDEPSREADHAQFRHQSGSNASAVQALSRPRT